MDLPPFMGGRGDSKPQAGLIWFSLLLANSRLLEDGQQADDEGKKCCTFNESADDDHTGLDTTGSFRLTGHGFHGRLTDSTDTDSGTDHCDGSCNGGQTWHVRYSFKDG